MSDDYQGQLEELKAKILHYHPTDDVGLVERAFYFAQEAHKDVMRKSGKPYFTHPLRVAFILSDLMMDSTTCAAGLLHDVVEDTDITLADITEKFGAEVALLVDGVTKLNKLDFTKHPMAKQIVKASVYDYTPDTVFSDPVQNELDTAAKSEKKPARKKSLYSSAKPPSEF